MVEAIEAYDIRGQQTSGVFKGALAPGPPFQPTIFFMMVFLAVLLIFSKLKSKLRHSVTKKRQLLGDEVPQTPYRVFASGPHWGTSVSRPPGPPPFAHSKYATATNCYEQVLT